MELLEREPFFDLVVKHNAEDGVTWPLNLASSPPEGFTGGSDVWHRNEKYGLWTLHAWIWLRNPDGVFTELNPRVP